MKSLKEYIKNNNIFLQIAISNKIEEFNEYFEGNIPEYILNNPDKFFLSDIINENLNSHDYIKLSEHLYKEFKDDIIGFEEYTGIEDKKSFIIEVKKLSIKNNNKFKSLLSFYNYYIRDIDKQNNYIIIAPIYSTQVNDYIWSECYGKGYIIVTKDIINLFLKNGLRCKSKVNKWEPDNDKLNNRCYMFATSKRLDNIKDIFYSFFNKIRQYKAKPTKDLSILRINLNKMKNGDPHKIIWFKDNLMTEKEAVFTEQSIPAECLSEVKMPSYLNESLNESKGEDIDEQWLNDEKPVMTHDGRQVIITKIDYEQVPNIIHGQVKMKEKLFDYEWNDDGMCTKAVDQMGNPKKPDEADKLVKAS